MNKLKRYSLTGLSLIGLCLAIELCVVYYNVNFAQNAAPSICAINESMNCDSVAATEYSQFLGVPLSLWGVCLYLFVLFITFVDKIKNIKFLGFLSVFKNQTCYIFCISLLSFIISMILAGISVFKIHSVCIFCLMTYVIDLAIAIVAKNKKESLLYELKTSINDFIDAIKIKRYAFWFILIVLLFCSSVTYLSISNILAPHIKNKKLLINNVFNYKKLTRGNELGPKNADVVIHEYIDFNCGGCFMAHLYMHRIIDEFENVKVIQHNLPLEAECNHNMKSPGHKNSCLKAKYAVAAGMQNKYWLMADLLFANGPDTEDEILALAKKSKFNMKRLIADKNSVEVENKIKEFIKEADNREINGTPTIFVGMQKLMGVSSYPEFKKFIIEHGGKEKVNHD